MSTPQPNEHDERVTRAESLLREAVYRSRSLQATSSALGAAKTDPNEAATGRCGLGERAAIALDLSDEGRALFTMLWPIAPANDEMERLRAAMADWVVEQDARDRKRNHFLKAFRQTHGFDRTRYTPQQTEAFESGLARINADEDAARRAAATKLLNG